MALPWIAKLPFLGIAGCDSATAASLTKSTLTQRILTTPMHTLQRTWPAAKHHCLKHNNPVANGAAAASLSYAVHARVLCQALPRLPCARSQHFAIAQVGCDGTSSHLALLLPCPHTTTSLSSSIASARGLSTADGDIPLAWAAGRWLCLLQGVKRSTCTKAEFAVLGRISITRKNQSPRSTSVHSVLPQSSPVGMA